MSIKKYEALVYTAEFGSLKKAAEKLNCTPSAVSHMISSLEDETGVPLLVRSRTSAELTEKGKLLFPMIREITDINRRIMDTCEALKKNDIREVRVGAFTSVAVHWLPSIIKQFQSQYSQVEIKLSSGDYHDTLSWLENDECDLCFLSLPAETDCRTVPLFKDRLLAVLPPDYVTGENSVALKDIIDMPFISLLEESSNDARLAFSSVGLKPRTKYATKDDYAVLAMAGNGLGYSIMPELLIKGIESQAKILPMDPPCERIIAIGISKRGEKNLDALNFLNETTEYISEMYGKYN